MGNEKIYYPPNSFRVCIDELNNDIIGNIYSPLIEEVIGFRVVEHLLVKMDKLFDAKGYPQSFQDKRSFERNTERNNLYFGMPERGEWAENIFDVKGQLKTYDIMMYSRQNTSWQGKITDVVTQEVSTFTGEMELVNTITRIKNS